MCKDFLASYPVPSEHVEFKSAGGIVRSFPTTGQAVVVTGLVVIAGIVFWYFSEVKFQAEMGFLLVFLLLVNMLGAIFLVPSLTYLVRGRFFGEEIQGKKGGGEH